MSPYFLIFGFGYTAKALVPQLTAGGFKITGTSRKPEELQKADSQVKIIDFNSPNMDTYLGLATHLLISIPPVNNLDDLVLTQYGDLIKKQVPHLQWVGYLSSTGVYGDKQGAWVDENTECTPHTPHGLSRLKAEQAWLSFAKENQLPLHIFRLSAIYGQNRNALERLKQGKKHSIFKEGQVFCRIHVEDIASTLLASIQSPKPLAIYNVADDEPASADSIDRYAASLLGQEPPRLIPFSEAELSPMEQEFYTNNRRVSNLKMKKELKVGLKYPTYREGLTQIWREDFGTLCIAICRKPSSS